MYPSVTIVGAGATGSYLAALLAERGRPVRLVARGATLAAIRAHGVVVHHPDGMLRAHPQVCATDEVPAETGFVFLCVKTYDNDRVLDTVRSALGPGATLVSLQNGIRNDQTLADAFGADRLLVCALYVAAQRHEPGVVQALSAPRVVVGPYAGPGAQGGGADLGAAHRLQELLTSAEIACDVDAQVAGRRWEKWVLNCALNALTAVTGRMCHEIMAVPSSRRLFSTVVDEALAAAQAAGAPVPTGARERVLEVAGTLRCGSSMAEDLQAGRPLERDEFTGELLRLLGDPGRAPVSATLDAVLELLDPASAPIGGPDGRA